MAGAGARPAATAGPEPAAGLRRRSAARPRRGTFARWACLAAVALLSVASAHAQVIASRIWPARDYTRLTLESIAELKYQVFAVKDPERLVVDLESEMTSPLVELDGKVMADDPYIKGLRVARNRPGVLGLVLHRKGEATLEVFALVPVAESGHRLVLDIYPAEPVDPLAELTAQAGRREQPPQDQMARLATIVLD